jgi:hypothetical protein
MFKTGGYPMFHSIILFSTTLLLSVATLAMADDAISKLPQTGQTLCYDASGKIITCSGTGQAGELQTGVAWPKPRFVDNANGTVSDNLTGLVWLKNANCFSAQVWTTAIASANGLKSGNCGLSDGSSTGQWRLPNVRELRSLINEGEPNSAAWLNTQGFLNVQSNHWYWSSSTHADYSIYAYIVDMGGGSVGFGGKDYNEVVWPVRAGQ